MPAMQFSIAPWDLSKDAELMCKQAVELRERLLHTILAVAEEAGHALEPICRPMWWLDPDDEETYQIKDQFVVGNDLIVAPVVYRVRFVASCVRLSSSVFRRGAGLGLRLGLGFVSPNPNPNPNPNLGSNPNPGGRVLLTVSH